MPDKLPWYKYYGFNTEQEFEQWFKRYGTKLKLKYPHVSAASYASYQEYLAREAIDRAKKAFQSPSPDLFGRTLKITTSNGKTWRFVLRKYHVLGPFARARDALYALCWLATSPLVTSIEASDEETWLPPNTMRDRLERTLALGQQGVVESTAFPVFWMWIVSGRIPLTLTLIEKNFPRADHPPLLPPPFIATSTTATPSLPGTTPAGTQPSGTTSTVTTQPPGTTPTSETAATTAVKSILPYVAIGAGVLLLLWAMKK
jgi:hypothetical protein